MDLKIPGLPLTSMLLCLQQKSSNPGRRRLHGVRQAGNNEGAGHSRKQRVIWHTHEPISASSRYPREMITALTEEDVPIHLVCPAHCQFRDELSKNPLVTLNITAGRSVDMNRGMTASLWTNARFILSSGHALWRTCRHGDIAHYQHVLQFPFSALFFAVSKLRGCNLILTVHDPAPHKWVFPAPVRWIERRSLVSAYYTSHALIIHTDPGKRVLIDEFGASGDKNTIIWRGTYGLGVGIIPMPDSRRFEQSSGRKRFRSFRT
jgi:hypothetical protein